MDRAFDAADRNGRVLAEAFMWRHHPQALRLRELAGELGELRLVRSAFSFSLDEPENIRLAADLDGGALMDVGCYCVSGARFLLGEPEQVTAHSRDDAVDVRFVATMSFASGALAHFDCGFDMPPRDELEVVGSEGSLFLDDPWHSRTAVIERRALDGSVEEVKIEDGGRLRLRARGLRARVRGRGGAPLRARGRRRPGAHDRRAVRGGGQRPCGLALGAAQAPGCTWRPSRADARIASHTSAARTPSSKVAP